MSYRRVSARPLGMAPIPSPFAIPTTAMQVALGPYVRTNMPGALIQPYGWGPNAPIGMPASFTHHIDYVRQPLPPGTYDTAGVYTLPNGEQLGAIGVLPILAVL